MELSAVPAVTSPEGLFKDDLHKEEEEIFILI